MYIKYILNISIDGATTVYTSSKANTNLNLLYEYILHRIHKFDFLGRINVIDKESYFIPAGYDSISVIKSYDINQELGRFFNDKIIPVKSKSQINEEEITCEDSQIFLKRYYGGGGCQSKQSTTTTRSIPKSIDTANYSSNGDINKITPKGLENKQESKRDFSNFYKDTAGNNSVDVSSTSNSKTSNQDKIDRLKKSEANKLFDKKDESSGRRF